MHSMYDDDGDLAHYFRFEEIKYDRAYLASDDADLPERPVDRRRLRARVPDVRQPPRQRLRLSGAPGRPQYYATRTWSRLLIDIDDALDGAPDRLLGAVPRILELRNQAQLLLANPLPEDPEHHAGPTFEWAGDGRHEAPAVPRISGGTNVAVVAQNRS